MSLKGQTIYKPKHSERSLLSKSHTPAEPWSWYLRPSYWASFCALDNYISGSQMSWDSLQTSKIRVTSQHKLVLTSWRGTTALGSFWQSPADSTCREAWDHGTHCPSSCRSLLSLPPVTSTGLRPLALVSLPPVKPNVVIVSCSRE